MDRRGKHLALVIVAVLVQLTCVTCTYAVSPHCYLSHAVNSAAENVLKGMTLDDCVVENNGDTRNTSFCSSHVKKYAVRLACVCGPGHSMLRNHLECDISICCKTRIWICLNGGTLTNCGRKSTCSCALPFHGDRCELVHVIRTCSTTNDNDDLVSCEKAGELKIDCLHTVNQNRFLCGYPVSLSEIDLPKCSKIPEGGLVTETPVVDSVTDEGPVTIGHWSAWSQWSVCSMADDAWSAGPCMCRRRECMDGSCEGTGVQVSNCTEHGHWTDWTPWSACSSTRGRLGERTRHRFCSNPAPKYGGRSCDGRSEGTEVQTENCTHDCPVTGSELQMTEFSSWANITFDGGVPGWLKVRTKLVCQTPGGELNGLKEEEVAEVCYLLKVSVEHCHTDGCAPLRGLRKLIEKSSAASEKPDN